MLKWKSSKPLLPLSEVHDSGMEVRTNCGPTASVVTLPLPADLVPDSRLCSQWIEPLAIRPFLTLPILASFMTQQNPKPSVTLTYHLFNGSNPVERLGSLGA